MIDEVQSAKIKIADKEYNIADLPEAAKPQLQGVRMSEAEIKRLNVQLALAKTARNAYIQALQTLLPE